MVDTIDNKIFEYIIFGINYKLHNAHEGTHSVKKDEISHKA